MKSKDYWQKEIESDATGPFDLPRRIGKGIDDSRKALAGGFEPTVRYLWICPTEDGVPEAHRVLEPGPALSLNEWLNVIDESASIGAEWLIVRVGASLAQVPHVWRVCRWAQETHGLRVGLHLTSNCLSEYDIEQLSRLDRENTYLFANEAVLASLRFLEASGFPMFEATVTTAERAESCMEPSEIAFVGPDGRMFSCGLVQGCAQYALGDAQDRKLHHILNDESLPHSIADTSEFPVCGCEACPPLMARRARAQQAR